MEGLNISKILSGLRHPELFIKKITKNRTDNINSFAPEINSTITNSKQPTNQLLQNLQKLDGITQILQMNTLNNTDRVVFIKNLLGLPQQFGDLLKNLQNIEKPINGGTLGANIINMDLIKNQNILESLFDETLPFINPKQIPIELIENNQKKRQDTVALLFSGMISLSDVSKLIIQNGRQAVAALIIAMATVSKQGMSNEQIQETLSIINSCISMAESNNPAQSLKSLMLLYLPWLPLNPEIGFDLEITTDNKENDSNNSKLTVLIQTKNYGNIKGIFTLTTSNSIDILISCSENFPKKILQKKLMEESSSHAMNTNIDIEEVQPKTNNINETHETKVNLSATNEMNPYLLLIAHSFIRNTIYIDNNISLEVCSD